jgi:hypothetical protein
MIDDTRDQCQEGNLPLNSVSSDPYKFFFLEVNVKDQIEHEGQNWLLTQTRRLSITVR